MHHTYIKRGLLCMGLWLLTISTVLAADPAAHVTALSGSVTAALERDLEVRALSQDDPVFVGDTVATGVNSRARLRFTDGGALTLRAETRLLIEAYQYTGDVVQDTQMQRLIRGGLRAVTGAVGDAQHENYRLHTPVATIGIRGTEFRLRFCRRDWGDCMDLQHIGIDPPPDGLYTQTLVGTLRVGEVIVQAGQAAFTNLDGVTFLLDTPPALLTLDPSLGDNPFAEDTDDSAERGVEVMRAGADQPIDPTERGSLQLALETSLGADGREVFYIPAQPPSMQWVDCQ